LEKDQLDFYFRETLALASAAAEQDEVPVGAVVVKDGAIIGRGYNRREQEQNPLGHAELYAITEASKTLRSWRLVGCSLFVTLEPCLMCLSACQQARIEKIYFASLDAKGGSLSLGYSINQDCRSNHRFEAIYHPVKEAEFLLKEFFKKKRQKQQVTK